MCASNFSVQLEIKLPSHDKIARKSSHKRYRLLHLPFTLQHAFETFQKTMGVIRATGIIDVL